MSSQTDIDVIIGGKVLTLSGAESVEYLQKVATFINNKIEECVRLESYKRQNQDMQNILLALNLADEYFKVKKQLEELEETLSSKEKELYNLKHELIASQIKHENSEKNIKQLEKQINEYSNKITRLESELKN